MGIRGQKKLFWTVREIADYLGLTRRMVNYLVPQKFPDAEKAGETKKSPWVIPKTAANRKMIECMLTERSQ